MRNKIKQLMNKEEGFTLVELLAVIVILGIIVAIAIPAIGSVISNADGEAAEAEQALVIDAARLYYTDKENAAKTEVTVDALEKAGYLDLRKSTTLDTGRTTIKVNRDAATGELDLEGYPTTPAGG